MADAGYEPVAGRAQAGQPAGHLPPASPPDGLPSVAVPSRAAPPQRPSPQPQRRTFAALDLGTNNCRLLIARPTHGGEFLVVDAFSRIVRLGEGLMQSGALNAAAMDRAALALAACADKLTRRGVTQVRSVATEAVRRAANGPEFVARVYRETGLALDVITPAEEARLAVIGCQTLLDPSARRALVFDIGGGSTEVALLEREIGGNNSARGIPLGLPGIRMRAWVSVPWGVVSLAETEPKDAGSPILRLDAYARMKARVAAHLGPLSRRIGAPGSQAATTVQLLGASGTVTTLTSIHLGLPQYDRRQVDGTIAPTAAMRHLSHQLTVQSPAERATIPGIGNDRADLVVAGCAILEALMDLSATPHLHVADRGIREGILRAMIARDMAAATAWAPAA